MSVLDWLHDCGTLVGSHLPLPAALLAGGLAGSFTHCLGMCSTFVLGQTDATARPEPTGLARGPGEGNGLGRAGPGLWARLLLPYHAGRLTTYSVLGALAGASFQGLIAWPPFLVLRHLMLAFVAVIFLTIFAERFLTRLHIRLPLRLPFKPACAVAAMRRASSPSASSLSSWQRYGLGLGLGLLPCPLVFAALLAVAARGQVVGGAVAMAAFGLGTMPALIGLSATGAAFLKNSPRLKDGLGIAALGVNGIILFGLAIG